MIIALIIILIIILLLWLICGLAAFFAAMSRGRGLDLNDRRRIRGTVWERYYKEITDGIAWFHSHEYETVTIKSRDGLTLYGSLIKHDAARGTVIMFHGYRTFGECDFSADADHYYSFGYNLLLVDQRACGRSGGRFITFGIRERYDCCEWISYVADRYGMKHEIFLGGLSLGGSTVLMASGEGLPANVKGMISDSAFSSPKDIIGRTIRNKYHLPSGLLMPVMNFWSRLIAGISLDEYSTLEAMDTNHTPVLFVHGKEDDYVPWEMTVKAYEKCTAPKFLYLVEGAEHGVSYMLEPDEYRRRLTEFFKFCQMR